MPQVRIRTVKPALFLHDELYLAERDSGLPLRLAFIGLFGHCCREGLFPWRPLKLGAHILPYDGVDFSRVLDALLTRGFLEKYRTVSGEELGRIPTFLEHQNINPKESKSPYPPLGKMTRVNHDNESFNLGRENSNIDSRASGEELTRESRDNHATVTRESLKGKERKGKEGKGNKKINTKENGTSGDAPCVIQQGYPDDFEELWSQYPEREGGNPKRKAYSAYKTRLNQHSHDTILNGVLRYAAFLDQKNQIGSKYVMQASTFFGPDEQFLEPWTVNHEANQRADSELSLVDQSIIEGQRLLAEGNDHPAAHSGNVFDHDRDVW